MSSNQELQQLAFERRYQLVVESIKDYAIYMLTAAGTVATWNPGAEYFKGYQAEEIIGRHFSCFYTEEDQVAGIPATVLETAAAQGKFEAEGWRVRKDGSRFWAHVVIDPVRDDAGNLIGFAKVTRDITEKRKAAELLQQTQAALAQAQKMEAIGKLTGGIAHDFSNLLQGIIGHLDMMRLRIALGRTSELGHHLEAAISATKRSATLTHRLHAFARRQTFPKHVPESADPVTKPAHRMAPPKVGQHSTVLVVDDERTVRSTLSEVLQHLGYDILVASDAQDALRVFEGNSDIDLLVTDIALPAGMNGRQLANRARQVYRDLKVLFVTGYAEQSVIGQEILPPGMQFLIKPFSMDAFVAAVVNMTEQT